MLSGVSGSVSARAAAGWVARVLPVLVLAAGLTSVAATAVGVARPGHAAWASTGTSQYVAVPSTRVCDTRSGNVSGLSGPAAQCNGTNNAGDPIGPGGSLNLVGSGTFGSTTIPSNAYALVVDVSVVSDTAATYMVAYKYGTTRPYPVVSVYDAAANHPVNSQVTVALGAGGSAQEFSLYNYAGTVNVTVDVVGYYLPPSGGAGFNVLAGGATRVCDTRSGNPSGLAGGPAQCDGASNAGMTLGTSLNKNSETLAVQVTGLKNTAGQVISPPAGATAAVVDLFASSATGGTFLTAYAAGSTKPTAVSLEVPDSASYNSEVTVPLSASGAIDITNYAGSVNVVVDVEGYFLPGSGDQYVPITAERICDTRAGNVSGLSGSAAQCNGTNNSGRTIAAGGTLTINVTSLTTGIATPIPINATAVVATVEAMNEAAGGWALVYPAGQAPGHTTSLDYGANTPVSNQVTVGLSSGGQLNIESTAATDVTVDIQGYYQALTLGGGPTSAGETRGGANPSEPDVTQPSTPAGDPASHASVDDATGALDVAVTDDQLPGNGIPVALTRIYSSAGAASSGAFGYGWADPYHMSVAADTVDGAAVMDVTQENGSTVQFGQTNAGTWMPPTRVNATLTYNTSASQWTFTRAGQDQYSFNSAGQLTSETDLDGYTTSFGYAAGQLTSVTAYTTVPAGGSYRQLSLAWGACGTGQCVTSVTDSAGRAVHYSYDANANLTGVEDLGGTWTYYGYDTGHHLTGITDPAGNPTSWAYNAAGQVSSETDPLTNKTTWAYSLDTSGNGTTTVTDPLGYQTQYSLTAGLLTAETAAAGTTAAATTTYSYDPVTDGVAQKTTAAGTADAETTTTVYNEGGTPGSSPTDVTSHTDPAGDTTAATYNADNQPGDTTTAAGSGQAETTQNVYTTSDGGDLTQSSAPNPNGSGTIQTALNYTTSSQPGDPSQVTSEGETTAHQPVDAETTTNGYDPYGDLTSSTDAANNTTTYSYNSAGQKTAMVAPAGNVSGADPAAYTTGYSYDGYGNVTQTVNPAGDTTKASYDPDGRQLTATDADGNTTTYVYDSDGQLTKTTQPDGHTTTYTYDADGNKLSETDADGQTTTYTYDPLGRQLTQTDPLGHLTADTYDPNGNKTSQTDPDGNTTTYAYDADNHLTATTEPGGTVVSSTYDTSGNQTTSTDGNGHTTTYTYNSLNQLTAQTDPLGHTTSYTYDPNGNKATQTNPDGQTTTWAYNGDNQPATITYSDGTHPVSYTYNADSKVTAMSDATGTTSYSYDTDDRLTASQDGAGASITYSYDPAGNVTTIGYPNGKTVAQTYNNMSQLATVTDWDNQTTSFGYDPDGNQTTITYPNGIIDTRTYNTADQVTNIADNKAATSLLSFAYTPDPDGLTTAETDTGTPNPGTTTNTYNPLQQLTGAGTNTYSYDPANNLTAGPGGSSQTFNADNQLCWTTPSVTSATCASPPAGATTYTYNNEGNRTTTTPPAGPATSYTWNQNNQLTQATPPAGSPTTYTYDATGLLQTETTSSSTTNYTWDTQTGLPQLLADATNYYIYGTGAGPIEQINATTSLTNWLLSDQLGSTRALTNTNGALTATISYDPWGNTTATTGTTTTPYLYAGQYKDPASGLYYLRARWYDPGTGQFLSLDPDLATTNEPYGYADENPIDNSDPSGESWHTFSFSTILVRDYTWAYIAARLAGYTSVPWWTRFWIDSGQVADDIIGCAWTEGFYAPECDLTLLTYDIHVGYWLPVWHRVWGPIGYFQWTYHTRWIDTWYPLMWWVEPAR